MVAAGSRENPCVRESAGLACVLGNALREIFEPWCEITGLKLDALGRVVADTNGLGYVARHGYGPNVDTLYDRKGYITIVMRDVLGRTTSLTDPNSNVTRFSYNLDALSGIQRDSVAYPDGTWEVSVTDKAGRVIQKLDKRGVVQSYVYGDDWGVDTVRYEMSGKATLAVAYERNAKGQVEKLERTEGGVTTAKTEYTFDDAGRVLSQKQTIGTEVKTTSYAYDMARRSVTLTLPDGTTRTKVLDERGRLDSVYLDGVMIADFVYNNSAHVSTTLGNGIEATYGRDVAGRLTSMAYGKKGLDPILRHDLGWDAAGQLVWAKKIPDAIFDERYGLDKQGQLTEWKIGLLNVANEILAPADSLGWNLDSRGNWTNVYDSKKTVDTRAHSGANAITSRNNVTFAYDAAGNLLSDGVHAYEWTLDGLLAKVSSGLDTVALQYDGMRRLVKRTELDAYGAVKSTTSMLYDGWQLAHEIRTTSTNTETRTYTYGRYVDDVLAVHVAGGNTPGTYYYHQGYNHDMEAITNASGQVVERYTVKPYGEFTVSTDGVDGVPGTADDVRYTQSTIGNDIVFQGRPFDAASGLYDFRNRQYSATLGRFISRDPAGQLVNPGFNLYQAFNSNPEMNVDPWGLLTASDGLSHYLDGSGTDLGMGFDELNLDGTDGKWWGITSGPRLKPGACCEERTEEVSKTKPYAIDKHRHTDQWALLGNITLKLTGTKKISPNCDCSFSGQISALPDYYDFNEASHRGFVGEAATTYGRLLGTIWSGKSYYIHFYGTRTLQFSCKGGL